MSDAFFEASADTRKASAGIRRYLTDPVFRDVYSAEMRHRAEAIAAMLDRASADMEDLGLLLDTSPMRIQ